MWKLRILLSGYVRQIILPALFLPFCDFLLSRLCISYVPDFESESVEYLLPSGLPSLKSENGPLFPVNQVREERWQQCLIPVRLMCPPPPRRWDVRTELRLAQGLAGSGHTQYLIIGSRRTLILGLRWVKILILLTCTLPWVKKTMTTTISRRWVSFSQICLFKLL